MDINAISQRLWGEKARLSYLLLIAVIFLFTLLGARDIWTQEHRWADIVAGMFARNDFLHPYLGGNDYYDKPLLSYWLIVIIAKCSGVLNAWSLRLPSALAGFFAVFSIYWIGKKQRSHACGLLAGWLLLSTFYFVFWARVSSADMLNVGGGLLAIAWYVTAKDRASFFSYFIFFVLLALTSLCKGLVGAIVPLIAVFVDLCLHRTFQKHLKPVLFLALIPAMLIYLMPFLISGLKQGLYLVYKENFLRYFEPFDHKGPIYTYFIYLPIYLLPWTIWFFPALVGYFVNRKQHDKTTHWFFYTLLLTFLFFSLSGSRRSYYVLPIVPFALLLVADWVLQEENILNKQKRVAITLLISLVLVFFGAIAVPAWYYKHYGVQRFSKTLSAVLEESKIVEPQLIMLDAESKIAFYFQNTPMEILDVRGDRANQTTLSLQNQWPILLNKPKNAIFVTRSQYLAKLKPFFQQYRVVTMSQSRIAWVKNHDYPIAFVPLSL